MEFFHHIPKPTHAHKRQRASDLAAERASQIAAESLSQHTENIIYMPGTTFRFRGNHKEEEQRLHRWQDMGVTAQEYQHLPPTEEEEPQPYDPYRKAYEMAQDIMQKEYSAEGHTKVYGIKSGFV